MKELLPFVIADETKCTGCRVCEVACHMYHHHVGKTVGTITESIVPKLYTKQGGAILCHQCEDVPCAQACAKQAIYVSNGRIVVDTGRCDNCRDCVLACPFGAIRLAPVDKAVVSTSLIGAAARLVGNKCDLCLGREQGPICVEACPEKALYLVHPLMDKRKKNIQAAESGKNFCWYGF